MPKLDQPDVESLLRRLPAGFCWADGTPDQRRILQEVAGLLLADELTAGGGAAAVRLSQILDAFPGGRSALGQLDIRPRLQQALAEHRELRENAESVESELAAAGKAEAKDAQALERAREKHQRSHERLQAARAAAKRHERIRHDIEVLATNQTAAVALRRLNVLPE